MAVNIAARGFPLAVDLSSPLWVCISLLAALPWSLSWLGHHRSGTSGRDHLGHRRTQDLDWTISMSSTEEELEDPNIFGKRKGLFGSGVDAFLVALHRCGKPLTEPRLLRRTAG